MSIYFLDKLLLGHCSLLRKLQKLAMYLLYIIKEIQKTRQMSSCCLGDRIYSFPCRASYFALGRIWRKDGLNSSFSSNHPSAIHHIFQIVLLQNSVPNTAVTTFAYSSVFILLLCFTYTAAFFIFVLLEPPFSYFCYWNLHFHIFVIVTSIFIFLLLEPPFSYFCYWNLHFRIFVIGTSILIFLLLEPLFSYFCYWNLFVHILLLEPFCSYFCYWNLFFHIFVIGTSFSIYFLLEPSFLLDWTSSRSIF